MSYDYYYNIIPIHGKVRNNLVYTSLISNDKKTFVKWFVNDSTYHMGKNQIVNSDLMQYKFRREVQFLRLMNENYPQHIPNILEIDETSQKIFFEIEDVDFWQLHYNNNCTFDQVLQDWQNQMLDIFIAHKNLNFYKYSLHPSSYFIVKGKLKSINYFFCYHEDEPLSTLEEHRSHISLERQEKMKPIMDKFNIDWNSKIPYKTLQLFCLESFAVDYPNDFIIKAKTLYA